MDVNDFRSLVRKVMFFITKICPITRSAVRALPGHMSSPGPDHWKAMRRLIGYMKQMELRGVLYVEPESSTNEQLVKHEEDLMDIDEFRSLVGKFMFFTSKMYNQTGSVVRAFSGHMS